MKCISHFSIKNLSILITTALGIYSGNVFSTTSTTTFTVSATVLVDCIVAANPLAFGNYDPVSASNVDEITTINVTCTATTPYNIGLDPGTGSGATVTTRKMTYLTNTLNYSLYQDAARTTVWGQTIGTDTVSGTGNGLVQPYTVYGRIPGSQAVPQGVYNDTITVTVTY